MIQAILFDFNGVIIDDEPVQLKAYQAALKEAGIELSEAQYYAALGMDDRAFVGTMFARAGKELREPERQSIIEHKSALHRELIIHDLPLFPGIVTFLKAASRHYGLGLVSMARNKEIDYVLERALLSSLFSAIVSAEDVAKHKPDPECYGRALEKLNAARQNDHLPSLAAHDCVAVENAPPGIQSARAVGMRTIGVTNTVTEAELRAAGATSSPRVSLTGRWMQFIISSTEGEGKWQSPKSKVKRPPLSLMNFIDILYLALRNLRQAKLRAVLTTMGVVVGVAVIVTMVSFGLGLQRNMLARFKALDLFNEISVFGRGLSNLASAGFDRNAPRNTGEGAERPRFRPDKNPTRY
jgi:HAD superfamily hydrolase (TIGR01509 family)